MFQLCNKHTHQGHHGRCGGSGSWRGRSGAVGAQCSFSLASLLDGARGLGAQLSTALVGRLPEEISGEYLAQAVYLFILFPLPPFGVMGLSVEGVRTVTGRTIIVSVYQHCPNWTPEWQLLAKLGCQVNGWQDLGVAHSTRAIRLSLPLFIQHLPVPGPMPSPGDRRSLKCVLKCSSPRRRGQIRH